MAGVRLLGVPELVGREREQRVLADTVDHVALGSGAVLLLTGEAGIGKTRLAQHGLDVARAKGFAVLHGSTQPFDRGLAYVPVVEALGRHLRGCSESQRARLVHGLPVLGRLFDGLDLVPVEPVDSGAWEKTRLYEAILRLLGRICDEAPVALLVDDAHWADSASLGVLGYLLRDLPDLPVLLIATSRPDDAGARAELSTFLQLAHRTGVARELSVGRLASGDVEVLLVHLLGGPVARDLTDVVAARSGGVPLFVQAFARWLRDEDRVVPSPHGWTLGDRGAKGLPPAVREIILAEFGRLSAAERAVVDLVAVGGAQAASRVLGPVASAWLGELDIGAPLSRLLQSGRIVEEVDADAVSYRFPHPLLHEVAYQAVPSPRRRQLHLRFASELERVGDVVGQATHCLAAGPDVDPAVAAGVLVAAGHRALEGYAFDEARTFFNSALDRAERARPDLVDTALVGLGDACLRANQLGEAVRAYERALDHPDGPRQPLRRAHLYQMIIHAESARGDLAAAGRHVEAGLAELVDVEPGDEQLLLLVARQVVCHRSADLAGVRRALREIEELAPRVGTALASDATRAARLLWMLEQGNYPAVSTQLMPPLNIFHRPWDQAITLGWRALMAASVGDLPALREANSDIAAFERDLGTFAWSYRGALYRFIEAFYAGEWDRAAEAFDPVITDDRADSPRMIAAAVMFKPLLAAFQADFDTAEHWLLEGRSRIAMEQTSARYPRMIHNLVAALVALEQDRPAAALEHLERNGDYILTSALPPWSLVALAEGRAKTGLAQPAHEAAERLAACGPAGSYPAAMASRLDGLVQLTRGEPAAGVAALLRARDAFARLGMPFEVARTTIEAGEALVNMGELPPASLTDNLTAAHRTASRLGAARYVSRSASILRAFGSPVPRPQPARGEELTTRQWEVAELAAQGLSNAAIAEQLVVSVRTVTSHLEHIYTRLGISSRAALASYATRTRATTGRT